MQRSWINILEAVLVAVSLAACNRSEGTSDPEADQIAIKRPGGVVYIPEKSPLRERLKLGVAQAYTGGVALSTPASVEADPAHFARIYPPLSGHVQSLFVRFGDRVARGQALLALDSSDFTAAQNDYFKARSAADLTERTLSRQRDLQEHGIAAKREVEQAENDNAVAKSELSRTANRLRTLGLNPERAQFGQPMTVYSPVAGRVVDMSVAVGEFRNDATAPMMTIADLSTVWLTANVQEKDASRIFVGQKVDAHFAAFPQEPLKGTVLFIGDLLDPDTRTIKVRIELPNPDGRLKPGMFATVSFSEAAREIVAVPTTALFEDGDTSVVFVETQPWTFQRRPVVVESQQGDLTLLKSGLSVGDRIVSASGLLLK
jgi:cobalt-zinc-cadmium efflux system membrane fusion protein